MAKQARNTFIGGMDQDTSKSKYSNSKYFRGTNIKVLTEEGLSTGNIENEDGNVSTFTIPNTEKVLRIQFANIENPVSDSIFITAYFAAGGAFPTNAIITAGTIEDLYKELTNTLGEFITSGKIKIINAGSYILLYTFPAFSSVFVSFTAAGTNNIVITTEVAAQINLKIIGWCPLNDMIVVFTTNETSETPSGSAGQIWAFRYDPVSNEIENSNNGILNPFYHLIYNNILDFSTYWHIGNETIGHYENSKTGRVYWTDEYNDLRSINILDTESLGLAPSILSISSGFRPSLPVVRNITAGGVVGGSMVQYCYRLTKTGGQVSTISPLTNPMPLAAYNHTNSNSPNRYWEAWQTSPAGYSGHTITYDIKGIDTSFTTIEHIAVVTTGGSPDIYKFKEEFIPQDGTLTVIHSDKGLNIPITPTEFVFLTRSFKSCKTITVKDKRLIAGNLKTIDTTIEEYDARAYRFNASRQSLLTDTERTNITIDGVTKNLIGVTGNTWNDIPTTFDCVNPSNKAQNKIYQYKSDGSTLGGEGININYTFVKTSIQAKNLITSPANGVYRFHNVDRVTSADANTTLLNNEKVLIPGTFKSFKGSSTAAHFTGYARGETYRFGITFFDLAGNPYNTKWIGDIKFPDSNDGYGLGNQNGVGGINSNTIGINFNVDISSIKNRISGYEIVRVKRDLKDRTRLGTGILNPFTHSLTFSKRVQSTYSGSNVFEKYKAAIIPGAPYSNYYGLADTSYVPTAELNAQLMYAFISPITTSSDTARHFNVLSGDTVGTIEWHYANYEAGKQYFTVLNSVAAGSAFEQKSVIANSTLYPASSYTYNPQYRESKTVNSGKILYPGETLSPGSFSGMHPGYYYRNSSGCAEDGSGNAEGEPSGWGNQKAILSLSGQFSHFNPNGGPPIYPNNNNYWRVVSYNRTLTNQYGGDTFEARSSNEYISTGSFIKVTTTSSTISSTTVYGGDVYTQYYPYHYFYHLSGLANAHYVFGLGFLTESPINIEQQYLAGSEGNAIMQGEIYAQWLIQQALGFSSLTGPTTPLSYNLYNKQNDTRLIYYPTSFINNFVDEQPHGLWASEKKLDGELYDSWKSFLINNYSEVEGHYGPINKIIAEADKFFFFQDAGFGVASVNDRTSVPSADGSSIVLGSGGILDSYGYISRKAGTKHKFSVVPGSTGIHFFDSNLMKWFLYGQGTQPLSDIKGLNSLFKTFNGPLLDSDRLFNRVGIHGIFDKVRNKVYMTFLNASKDFTEDFTPYDIVTRPGSSLTIPSARYVTFFATNLGKHKLLPGDKIRINGTAYIPLSSNFGYNHQFGGNEYTVVEAPETSLYYGYDTRSDDALTIDIGFDATFIASYAPPVISCSLTNTHLNYTISYNENIQAFESDYDYRPNLYLEARGKLLSVYGSSNKAWLHHEGGKNFFYGKQFPSKLEMIIAPDSDITKVFDNVTFKGEIFNNDVDQSRKTLTSVQVMNDHQDSTNILFNVGKNIIRTLRSWKFNVPRDAKSPRGDARIRDYFMKLIFGYSPDPVDITVSSYQNSVGGLITLNATGIGLNKSLLNTKVNVAGIIFASLADPYYVLSGLYLITAIPSDDSITIQIPVATLATSDTAVTGVVVTTPSNERMVLHDILTTYRYSPN